MPNKIEIDLHGMEVLPAKQKLQKLIANCNKDVTEIVVIHGYRSGTAIKEMIASQLKSKRIWEIQQSILNPGQTTIFLKRSK